MATQRDRPYGQFNFLVDLGDGVTDGPHAGFQEVGRLAVETTVIEYRNGNAKTNAPIKLTGLSKTGDVTLKRGIIGALDLFHWFDQVRNGDQGAVRNVTIRLMSEDHAQVVQTWKLANARIVRHVGGPFDAKDGDVAIEEIVLAVEHLSIE